MTPHELATALRSADAHTLAAAIWSCDRRRRRFIAAMATRLPATVRKRQNRVNGRKGGERVRELPPEERRRRARHAARVRWGYEDPKRG